MASAGRKEFADKCSKRGTVRLLEKGELKAALVDYFPIQKVKFPIIAGLARRLGDRLGTKLQLMVKYLLPKMTSIIDQDGKSGNGGKRFSSAP